ncbi:hypothetical protein E2542_SST06068 [Spatholobus suberectus]|nr:hypothetical protein E2542_SST06068 [Spatholobus suberectus]
MVCITAWSLTMLFYYSLQDCTIKVWETTQGKLICELKKVRVQLGVEEMIELSPILCSYMPYIRGKLVMFHIACLARSKALPEVDSVLHNDEDTSVNLPDDEGCTFLQGLQKQELDKTFEVSGNLMAKPSGNPQPITRTDTKRTAKNLGQKTVALRTSIGSLTVNSHSASPGLSSYNNLQATTGKTTELWIANSSRDSQRASNLLPGETFSFPKKFDVSSISASSYADGVGFQSQKYTMGATNVLGSIGGKPFLGKDVNGVSPAINSACRPVQSGGN